MLQNQETAIRIPMIGDIRSLNLGNSVAIVLYEALRQHDFDHMRLKKVILQNMIGNNEYKKSFLTLQSRSFLKRG